MPISAVTQRIAYQAIRRTKSKKTTRRRATFAHVDCARETVAEICEYRPSDRDIYAAVLHPDFRVETRQLLWRAMHKAHRCGDFFLRMGPEWQHRGICRECDPNTDSFLHTITECTDPARTQIWDLARDLWIKRGRAWPEPTFGLIIGCGAVKYKSESGRTDVGISRLYRILVAKATHLIWRLRCNRRIEHADEPDYQHAPAFVAAEFERVIRSRFDTDSELVNKKRYGRRALKASIVEATWRKIFPPPDPPLPEWMQPPAAVRARARPRARPRLRDND